MPESFLEYTVVLSLRCVESTLNSYFIEKKATKAQKQYCLIGSLHKNLREIMLEVHKNNTNVLNQQHQLL